MGVIIGLDIENACAAVDGIINKPIIVFIHKDGGFTTTAKATTATLANAKTIRASYSMILFFNK
jgi:hypothetical protein